MVVRTITLVANRAIKALSANPDRKVFTIKNDSGTAVFVGHRQDVATSGYKQGYKVDPGGGAIEDEFHKGDVWVISTAAVSITVAEDIK